MTVFRVTSAILKMGHGQVRCGKCRTQFDALESLIDDEAAVVAQNAKTKEHSDNAPLPTPGFEARESDVAEEITLEGSRIEISGTYRIPADNADDNPDNNSDEPYTKTQVMHEHVVIDRDEPLANTDNEIEGYEPEEQVVEIAADDGVPVSEAADHLLADTHYQAPISRRRWQRAQNKQAADNLIKQQLSAELDTLTFAPAISKETSSWWTIASVFFILLMCAQVLHYHRDSLVRDPKYGATVSGIYRTLGLRLTPRWELNEYELQQWGVISDSHARGALRVRASVTNNATFAQPYPIIKLVLEDRWGTAIAMRAFTPEEYLATSALANRMMAPNQRTNANIVIVDPGTDAVGFQIHACLTQSIGIICTDDLRAKK